MAGLKDGISGGGGGISSTTGTFSGNVTLGDASGDAITVTGTMTCTPSVTLTGGATVSSTSKLYFRDTGIYLQSAADGKLTISADGVGADDLTISCTSTFSDNLTVSSSKVIYFRDTGISIGSATDGHLDLTADVSIDLNTGADTDLVLNFTGTTNSGVLTWMEDEDYFKFSDDVLMNSTEKLLFQDTGTYINSSVDGQLDVVADTTLALSGAITADSTVTVTTGVQCAAVSKTPTADGTGTGLIADGTSVISVADSADANKIITLPTPTPGNVVWLLTQDDPTGFELRTDTPASVSINGGTGASAESAIAAAIVAVRCVCVSADYWLCSQFDADGDESKVEQAA